MSFNNQLTYPLWLSFYFMSWKVIIVVGPNVLPEALQ